LREVEVADGLPQEHAGDLFWYRAEGIKSEPDWSDKKLGLHDKYTCCGYNRIVYSYFLNDHAGLGRKEAHDGYCGDCAKELKRFLPHKVDESKAQETVLYFGKHKGKKLADIPVDYLEWCVDNISDKNTKRKIVAYLATVGGPDNGMAPNPRF
jgi:hypothetical protein